MNENEIASVVINEAIAIHQAIGPGLLESVYEIILDHELKIKGFNSKRQVLVPFKYKNILWDKSFVADIIVNDLVILEIKSQKTFQELHRMQLLTYLRISNKKLGLVLNFGMELMRDGISRVVNGLI